MLFVGCLDERIELPGGEFALAAANQNESGGNSSGENSTAAETSGVGATAGSGSSGASSTEKGAPQLPENATAETKPQHFSIRINLEKNNIDLIEAETLKQTIPFKRRKKRDWQTGCPKQFAAELIEVVDLQVPQIDFAGVTITNPILMGDCMGNPAQVSVFLRSADAIPELGTYCEPNEACLQFNQNQFPSRGYAQPEDSKVFSLQ